MDQVGIGEPETRVDAYPFELSGGMRQRVMIAAAIACEPEMLLCDEPTTALDVTVQAQIIALFASLQKERHLGLLYVTHDLAVVAQLCTSLSVMRVGQILESGRLQAVLDDPQHEYTRSLLLATPRIDGEKRVIGTPVLQGGGR
jgi:ABC-type dipeptide/oligopeptide/nickel transport system ATPase component